MAQAPRLKSALRFAARAGAAGVSLLLIDIATANALAPRVFTSEAITIRAGISGGGPGPVRLGEALTLTIEVSYDSDAVTIAAPDDRLFKTAVRDDSGITLLDWHARSGKRSAGTQRTILANYRFQVTACPGGEPLCPGDRRYRLPAFALAYRDRRAADTEADFAEFIPWPGTLTVVTTIAMDDEGQLAPFETYFPAGGYPKPWPIADGTRASVLAAGLALAFLTGGFFMWPFRSRKAKGVAQSVPRWQALLDELEEADPGDEARYLDGLRRSLVWYCNDELDIDPFLWLDLAEPGDENGVDNDHWELRSLFLELLHNPSGKTAELRGQLERLTAQAQ